MIIRRNSPKIFFLFHSFMEDPNRSVNPKILEKFIGHCTDLKLQIQLASDLDLRGFMSELQRRDCSSYVQDIMASS